MTEFGIVASDALQERWLTLAVQLASAVPDLPSAVGHLVQEAAGQFTGLAMAVRNGKYPFAPQVPEPGHIQGRIRAWVYDTSGRVGWMVDEAAGIDEALALRLEDMAERARARGGLVDFVGILGPGTWELEDMAADPHLVAGHSFLADLRCEVEQMGTRPVAGDNGCEGGTSEQACASDG